MIGNPLQFDRVLHSAMQSAIGKGGVGVVVLPGDIAGADAPALLPPAPATASQIAARVAALDDVVRSAGHEPDAAAVRARHEALRRDGYARIIARLSERFGLNPLLNAGQATDLMLTLGGNAVYRTLVLDYGWRHETFVDWLGRSLCQQLTPSADASTTDRSVEKKRT